MRVCNMGREKGRYADGRGSVCTFGDDALRFPCTTSQARKIGLWCVLSVPYARLCALRGDEVPVCMREGICVRVRSPWLDRIDTHFHRHGPLHGGFDAVGAQGGFQLIVLLRVRHRGRACSGQRFRRCAVPYALMSVSLCEKALPMYKIARWEQVCP